MLFPRVQLPQRIKAGVRLFALVLFLLGELSFAAGDLAKIPLFRNMRPVRLANCGLLMRPSLSYANFREYLDRFNIIRFVVGVDSDHRPMLFLLRKEELHHSFVGSHFFEPRDDHGQTKFINGTITPNLEGTKPLFEFYVRGAARLTDSPSIRAVARLLSENINIPGARFKYSRDHDDEGKPIPLVSRGNAKVYNPGWALGRLVFVDVEEIQTKLTSGEITVHDVIVVNQVPEDLPPFAGVITQTPNGDLSHVQRFSSMLGFPFVYLPETKLRNFRKLNGKVVLFQAALDSANENSSGNGGQFIHSWKITPPSQSIDLAALRSINRHPKIVLPLPDESSSAILPLHMLSQNDAGRVGAKAANLGFLTSILGADAVPQGVAIPFYYYAEFLRQTKIGEVSLYDFIQSKLRRFSDSEATPLTFLEATELLEEVRSAITSSSLTGDLLMRIVMHLRKHLPASPMGYLFRSSASVEDGEHFSGVGLYDSAVAENLSARSIETAFKRVGASLYNLSAVYSRRAFQIDEAHVDMAIVVHPSHENPQIANGGSRLKWFPANIEQGGLIEVTHAALPGNQVLVTAPLPGLLPEVLNVTVRGSGELRVLQEPEDLLRDSRIFSVESLNALDRLLATIVARWPKNPAQPVTTRTELDVEWYLLPGRSDSVPPRFMIRQVRLHPRSPGPTPREIEDAIGEME